MGGDETLHCKPARRSRELLQHACPLTCRHLACEGAWVSTCEANQPAHLPVLLQVTTQLVAVIPILATAYTCQMTVHHIMRLVNRTGCTSCAHCWWQARAARVPRALAGVPLANLLPSACAPQGPGALFCSPHGPCVGKRAGVGGCLAVSYVCHTLPLRSASRHPPCSVPLAAVTHALAGIGSGSLHRAVPHGCSGLAACLWAGRARRRAHAVQCRCARRSKGVVCGGWRMPGVQQAVQGCAASLHVPLLTVAILGTLLHPVVSRAPCST